MLVIKNILRVIGQLVSIFILSIICFWLFEFNIPGNHTFTDDDQIGIGLSWITIIFFGLGLIFNSIFHIQQNHWKKYRNVVLVYTVGLLLFAINSKGIINWIYLGKKHSEYVKSGDYYPDMINVNIDFFDNDNFLCTSSWGGEITVETTGKYKIENDSLSLTFVNKYKAHLEKYYQTLSKNIGTKYKVENDTLICLDCENKIKLIQKNN